MSKIKTTFPDKSSKSFEKGVTVFEVAESIGPRLAEAALAAKVNDKLVDLSAKINKDSKIRIITFKDKEK